MHRSRFERKVNENSYKREARPRDGRDRSHFSFYVCARRGSRTDPAKRRCDVIGSNAIVCCGVWDSNCYGHAGHVWNDYRIVRQLCSAGHSTSIRIVILNPDHRDSGGPVLAF